MLKGIKVVRRTVLLKWHWNRIVHYRRLAQPLLKNGIPRENSDACEALLQLQRKVQKHICQVTRLTQQAEAAVGLAV